MRYLVVIERTKNGFSAYVPDLPGCITVGDTFEDTEKNIYEAMDLYLEEIELDGKEPPLPLSTGEMVYLKRDVQHV